MRQYVLLILVVFLFSGVNGLGVSPGRTVVDFAPGLEGTYSFTVLNTEQKDISLVVSPQGELQSYIFPRVTTLQLESEEVSQEIFFDVRLPAELEPGLHTGGVAVVELPEEFVQAGETSVGAAVAVLSQLNVDVPFPGKFVEVVALNVLNKGGGVEVIIPIVSKGEFDLESVRAKVDILALGSEEKLAVLETNDVALASGGRAELKTFWNTEGVGPGTYVARAIVQSDEDAKEIEKQFVVGKKRLILESVEVNDFSLGDIAKFEVAVSNSWSEPIEVHADMVVYSDVGNVLANFKSPNAVVEAGQSEQVLAFWDTDGVREGEYDSVLFLVYQQVRDPTELNLQVESNKITIVGAGVIVTGVVGEGGSNLVTILIGVIAFLVVANVSWFVYLRKKFRKK